MDNKRTKLDEEETNKTNKKLEQAGIPTSIKSGESLLEEQEQEDLPEEIVSYLMEAILPEATLFLSDSCKMAMLYIEHAKLDIKLVPLDYLKVAVRSRLINNEGLQKYKQIKLEEIKEMLEQESNSESEEEEQEIDSEEEEKANNLIFKQSNCTCVNCKLMNKSIKDWDTYEPKNEFEKRMKNSIEQLIINF